MRPFPDTGLIGGGLLREGVRALVRNKLRSGLSALGICVGVAAVICVIAIGQGGSEQIARQWHNLGDNQVWVEAGAPRMAGVYQGAHTTKTLTVGDANAIRAQVALVTMVSPNVDSSVQTIYGNENWGTTVHGVGPQYFAIRNFEFDQGAPFTQEDVTHANNVCVLGQTVKEQLFGAAEPIGQVIRIKNLPFTVVGTLQAKGQSSTGYDQDDLVVVPYTTAMQKLLGMSWLDDIYASVGTSDAIPLAETDVTGLLHDRHRIQGMERDDFKIRHPEDIIESQRASQQTLSLCLISLGTISLLVGGIGVMNVMLAAVVERTREIGVRLAVGATERDVAAQFLGEAALLSLAGGVAGIALGAVTCLVMSQWLQWPMPVSAGAALLGFGIAGGVGVGFGYYPARAAARLDPIEALRFE